MRDVLHLDRLVRVEADLDRRVRGVAGEDELHDSMSPLAML